ncbi:MAG: acylphosphatase [Cyclobacteriaceae bacterium]|jgi:acylphosphatase
MEKAIQLGLSGIVRNLQDGKVEILAKGESHATDSLLSWCETGSPLSQVSSVSSKVIDGVDLPWPFEIAY